MKEKVSRFSTIKLLIKAPSRLLLLESMGCSRTQRQCSPLVRSSFSCLQRGIGHSLNILVLQDLKHKKSFVALRHISDHQLVHIQYLLLVGSGLGLLVTLLSSRPRILSHFFVASSSSLSNSGDGSFRWMKLQNPPLTHPSPLFNLQHASRKSVTGDNSA